MGGAFIENDDDEIDSVATTTFSPNQSSVVEAALTPSFTTKSPISAAQARCLDMQTKQHEVELELLDIKKNNIIIEHKRKMELLDAERQYWDAMKKSMKTTQEQQPRPNTRARKPN